MARKQCAFYITMMFLVKFVKSLDGHPMITKRGFWTLPKHITQTVILTEDIIKNN